MSDAAGVSLATSLAEGPHALLATFVGTWAGSTRTWFTPGEPASESPTSGTVRAILGGRFVVHEYRGSVDAEEIEGQGTLGFDGARNRFVCAWVDSFHTGTAVMLSEGEPGVTEEISVLGSYEAPDGSSVGLAHDVRATVGRRTRRLALQHPAGWRGVPRRGDPLPARRLRLQLARGRLEPDPVLRLKSQNRCQAEA